MPARELLAKGSSVRHPPSIILGLARNATSKTPMAMFFVWAQITTWRTIWRLDRYARHSGRPKPEGGGR